MNKKLKTILMATSLLLLSGTARADLNCTATPDCATLGYNKIASQCPNGGVKCPFDSTKMFCLKNSSAFNFQIKNAAVLYDVVYSDGTHSTNYAYKANNPAIGIITYIHPNTSNMRGIILSKEQPITGTYAEAIEYCNTYSIIGTNPGDWRLPTMIEVLQTFGNSNFVHNGGSVTNRRSSINSKMQKTRRGVYIGYSSTNSHNYTNNTVTPDYDANTSTYSGIGMLTENTGGGWEYFWTANDCWSNPATNGIKVSITTANEISCETKTQKRHFRCVMDF